MKSFKIPQSTEQDHIKRSINLRLHIFVCIYVYTYTCTYVYIYVCVYIYIYIRCIHGKNVYILTYEHLQYTYIIHVHTYILDSVIRSQRGGLVQLVIHKLTCMYVHRHINIQINIHIHIHNNYTYIHIRFGQSQPAWGAPAVRHPTLRYVVCICAYESNHRSLYLT